MKHLDRRMNESSEVRVASGDDAKKTITGYAAVFNSFTQIMPGFREMVRPGAFKKTIREADVRALMNHDPNFVLGRTSARTLRLSEDEKGLKYTINPPDTSFANDLMVSIERGDVTQSSFGFNVVKDKWIEEGDMRTRELIEVKLWDVSPVTFAAYSQTEVSVRSMLDYLAEKKASDMDADERRVICNVIESIRAMYHTEPDTRHSDAGRDEPDAAEAALHSQGINSRQILSRRLELLLVS